MKGWLYYLLYLVLFVGFLVFTVLIFGRIIYGR